MLKVDETLGLVFGWGIVCTEKGAPYYDLQGDHIPDPVMLEGVSDYMDGDRVAKDMHTGQRIGKVVHSWPMTQELAEKFGVSTQTTGWMVGWKPDDRAILKMFASGDRTGFSIGGSCIYELEDA